MRSFLCLLGCAALLTGGCVSRSTGETEVGVLVCKLSPGCEDGKGVQTQVYPPGSTNFFAPFIRDFYRFDTKVQNLEMISASTKGDRAGADDLQFKTTDGNDISMDVTVVWQIDSKLAPQLLLTVGKSTNEVKEKLVRPMARTVVRDILNELTAEAVYNADKRFEKAENAKLLLERTLAPYGVVITQVILHEHRFHPEYEKIIHERKLAEQQAEQLKSETEAAAQEAIRNLETARGKVASEIEQARGALDQQKLAADAQLFQQDQNAQAIISERQANAAAITARNRALAGAGGRAMVKLAVAGALKGKKIVLIPGGAGGVAVNRLDINKLVDSLIARETSDPN